MQVNNADRIGITHYVREMFENKRANEMKSIKRKKKKEKMSNGDTM